MIQPYNSISLQNQEENKVSPFEAALNNHSNNPIKEQNYSFTQTTLTSVYHQSPLSSLREVQQGLKIKGKRKGAERQNLNIRHGHWALEENKKYHWFLQIHYKHFVNRHLRRMDKIFKTMQIFVETRQAEQCRSHHQKMQKKYHNFPAIIANLRSQHYNDSSPQPIIEELVKHGIEAPDSIATLEELIQQQGIDSTPIQFKDKRKSRHHQQVQPSQIEQAIEVQPIREEEPEQQKDRLDMFAESNQLGEIDLDHLRYENSSIYNVFQ